MKKWINRLEKRAGAFRVVQYNASPAYRSCRLAGGMSFTYSRHKSFDPFRRRDGFGQFTDRTYSEDALRLMVRGTLDKLAAWHFNRRRKPCPECNQNGGGKWVLSDSGRARLKVLRRRAKARGFVYHGPTARAAPVGLAGLDEARLRDALWQLERMDWIDGKPPTLGDAVCALRGLEPVKLSAEEIASGQTEQGGFTRDQLALWGVPWPPPRGWKRALLRGEPIPAS